VLLLLVMAAGCGPTGVPRAREGTLLRKVQDRGRLIVGVKHGHPTFGYRDPKTHAVNGFDPAVGREIAAHIFGEQERVEFTETITRDRIPFLQSGRVDVVLSTMTITEERLKQIEFSVVYYVAGQRLLVPKGSPIKGVADLDGKRVATTRDSTAELNLRKQNGVKVVLFDTHSEGVQALLRGEVDAESTDDTTLYGLALLNPGLEVVGAPFSYEPYGAGIASGHPEFLELVNSVIRKLKTSSRWKEIWKAEIGERLGIFTTPEPPPDDWRR
jgi:putative glutamine transport system substrate-binding protein